MSIWDTYHEQIEARGKTRRGNALIRTSERLLRHIPDTLSYQESVEIMGADSGYGYCASPSDTAEIHGVLRDVAIINSDNLDEKLILSLPGEDIEHGSLVRWMDNYWLVTERDANTTMYTRAKMVQCNHLLRWVTDEDKICEQWCIIEDGTKYLTGELEDRQFIVTRGDSRIAMTLARNVETVKLNRENRFLIDDPESPIKLAYQLTKPLKLGWSFNSQGAFKFVLQEVTATKDDYLEYGIADYYKHFPTTPSVEPVEHNGRRGWL